MSAEQTSNDIAASSQTELELDVFVEKYWKTEYSEVCANIRHAGELRMAAVRFWLLLDGTLLLAVGALLSYKGEMQNTWYLVLWAIGICGLVGSLAARVGESRAYKYYQELTVRLRILEASVGLYGQAWHTFDKSTRNNGSTHSALHNIFIGGAVAWVVLIVLITISTMFQVELAN